ncbi:MAG: tRNA (adenosine(37)-N6)-dimethylallyltransferase MiaA, partial [Desulfovibrio sp.]|nr:tRNA (adenosine(37)-N6)-dimethylallyltransferase MiaA [Desulfovibrio sp.]
PSPEAVAKIAALADGGGLPALRARLMEIDGQYAEKVHPNDKNRLIRALEVYEATGKTFSWWHRNSPGRPMATGRLFVLRLPMPELERRLYNRVDQMLARGALLEAEEAWRRCPDESAPAWTGIGPREIADYRAGRVDLATCVARWRANTRAYARRQATWFRGRSESVWIDAGYPEKLLDSSFLSPFLSG